MLLRSETEQEIVSRERKDRRDYEHLAPLAERMGFRQYAKVSIPVGLQREVDGILGEYITRKRTNRESFPSIGFSRSSSTDSFATDEGFFEQQDLQTSTSVVMEKILRRRSLQLRNQQQTWQDSSEGQKMLEFRRSLPAFKEKETLLAAISQNQVFQNYMVKRDVLAESAKSQFSCRDYSDHIALVRAYDGWKDAEREHSGYEYCWKNFLSAQTLKAIDSLRKQFLFLLKDTGLVTDSFSTCNKWSQDENLIRAVICAGLYPGVCSVVDGHLKMLGGYLEFFMNPDLQSTYLNLKRELEELIYFKVSLNTSFLCAV
ncbi:hypothetical protein BHM03_00002613 [Ensete ventricosum]|nr:hypothetical protein BHM03_00002613 [Ensete ventricosum]